MDQNLESLRHSAAKGVDEFVESTFPSGMEPSEEARGPAFGTPAEICGAIGSLAGGILSVAAGAGIAFDHGVPGSALLWPLVAAGFLGAFLGAALGGTLRASEDALWIFPGFVTLLVGGIFGGIAAVPAAMYPGVPRLDALVAGTVIGVVLASLFRIFASRLP